MYIHYLLHQGYLDKIVPKPNAAVYFLPIVVVLFADKTERFVRQTTLDYNPSLQQS